MSLTRAFQLKQVWHRLSTMGMLLILGVVGTPIALSAQAACTGRMIKADVVALDQAFFWNRLGAVQPQGMMFALRRDVVPIDPAYGIVAGNVKLRSDKRPRPITLRMNVGDCLEIMFQNLLRDDRDEVEVWPLGQLPRDEQPATRTASVRVLGMQLVNSILDDGSYVGKNESSLVAPEGTATYTLYAEREGTHMLYSGAAMTGGEGDGGSIPPGLFGAVNIEPTGARWLRSQVTEDDMRLATVLELDGYTRRKTDDGQPILNYAAKYLVGPNAGLPIFDMLNEYNEIVHSDLNAIIVGGRSDGTWPDETFPDNPILGDREEPFREFTIIFHDEIGAVQAFPAFDDDVLGHTLACCRDGFAINYGTGGIGAEILANRIGVGPMWNCNECKYEEFFLESAVVGDPAMVVDYPANADMNGDGAIDLGPKATMALYPDDPSNVYHSYLNDRVKIRNIHVGPKEHHIFHLHAHQWLNTPDDDNSSYLDSQAIGPGSEYTYDMTHSGSGNRPRTPGDAIFHCHFYPHFAQGMWALWRVHDVFEAGTELDGKGRPVTGARALPDGEIKAGTPIPGLVPIPGLAMAPMPTYDLPGYPFYIPTVAGHRAPTPPLDTEFDGGLPRHTVVDAGVDVINGQPVLTEIDFINAGTGGAVDMRPLNRLDFSKRDISMNAMALPEYGTPLELNAMDFHAGKGAYTLASGEKGFASWAQQLSGNNVSTGYFMVNGLPPVSGAPYADPCAYSGVRTEDIKDRVYKVAAIQIDAKYNKAGWHFPQHRMLALREDVAGLLDGSTPPEPLFFRANTNDCVVFEHTNLVPAEYDLDDFQVQTPTDIIGQHIHLVKFDVTSSDGSANGWNYEDGTFSPEEVRERIAAINLLGGLRNTANSDQEILEAKYHPFFNQANFGDLGLGAKTTVQRWFADEVINRKGQDRTLRTVFTHDHFGPSTHQQTGFYASLVAEPAGSEWLANETGTPLGTRDDGGPTSWQAIIQPGPDSYSDFPADSAYREFMFQMGDFHLAYTKDADLSVKYFDTGLKDEKYRPIMVPGIADPANAINPPGRQEVGLPFLLNRPQKCPGGVAPPCPEGVSADDPGTMLVNYRNEPIPLRIRDPQTNTQATGVAGDLAHVFRSELGVDALGYAIERADPDFRQQPNFYEPLTQGVQDGDPFTPLIRVYEDDRIQIRVQVGSTEEGHNMSVHGIKWLFEPSAENSGWRNAQIMGISEHMEFVVPGLGPVKGSGDVEDYLYMLGASTDDLWNGTWGIMRAYDEARSDLATLQSNTDGKAPRNLNNTREGRIAGLTRFNGVCPADAPDRSFSLVAVRAQDVLPAGAIVYNSRRGSSPGGYGGQLDDPTAIMYLRKGDIDGATGQIKDDVPVEPLILRVNAGDCVSVTLTNNLPPALDDLNGFNTLPMIVDNFNNNEIRPSSDVGLHVQLLAYDNFGSDGANVGFNPVQTAAPGGIVKYKWYAGDVEIKDTGERVATPVEFGAVALSPADRIKQAAKGAIGMLIVEPQGSTWQVDSASRASASVYAENADTAEPPLFREFSLIFQDDLNLRCEGCGEGSNGDADAVPNLADAEDPEDSGQKAINYRTEPFWKRMGFAPNTPLEQTRNYDFTDVLSNSRVDGDDPVTPVFTAAIGDQVRFRLVHPGGHARNHVFTVHGHIWEEEPFTEGSSEIGTNPLSEWKGAQSFGPFNHFNFLLKNGAGGKYEVPGDYLYRDVSSFLLDGGIWGIFRVEKDFAPIPGRDPDAKKGDGSGGSKGPKPKKNGR